MSFGRHPILTLIAAVVIGWIVWQPTRALLFGGRVFSKGASGQWVGTMDVTYPVGPGGVRAPAKKAAIYFKLGVMDSFMDEYGGPGEITVAGQPKPITMRIGAFRLSRTDTRVEAAFIAPGFLDTTLHQCAFSPGVITLHSNGDFDQVAFESKLHEGTMSDYHQFVAEVNH